MNASHHVSRVSYVMFCYSANVTMSVDRAARSEIGLMLVSRHDSQIACMKVTRQTSLLYGKQVGQLESMPSCFHARQQEGRYADFLTGIHSGYGIHVQSANWLKILSLPGKFFLSSS